MFSPTPLRVAHFNGRVRDGAQGREFCIICEVVYSGHWPYFLSGGKISPGSLRLTSPFGSDGYVFMPQLRRSYAVSIMFLELAYEMMFARNASFNDVASSFCNLSLRPETASRVGENFRLLRKIAHRSLILYIIAKMLPPRTLKSIRLDFREGRCADFLYSDVVPLMRTSFRKEWIYGHACAHCHRGYNVVIDGNAKLRRKVCASKRGDYLKCESLQNKLTVRCNKRPKPKGDYCSEHEDGPESENDTCAEWATITEIWRAQMDNSCPVDKTGSGKSDGSKQRKYSARA